MLISLTEKELKLLAESWRDVQKAMAWEREDDETWMSIGQKARRALSQRRDGTDGNIA